MSETKATATWREIKPFAIRDIGSMLEDAKSKGENDGYFIILCDTSAQRIIDYSVSMDGLLSALAAAESGDIILLPYGSTISSSVALTVPSGVTVVGYGVGASMIISVGDVGGALVTLSSSAKLENLSVIYSTANSAGTRSGIYMSGAGSSVRRIGAHCENSGSGDVIGLNMETGTGNSYASYSSGTANGIGKAIGIKAGSGARLRVCQGVSYTAGGGSAGIAAHGSILHQCQAWGDEDGTGGVYGLYVYSSGGAEITQVYDGTAKAATKDLYVADANATVILYALHYDTYTNNGTMTPAGGDRSAWDALNFPSKHANDIDVGIHWTEDGILDLVGIGANSRHEMTTTQPGGTLNLIDDPITVIDNALNNGFPSIVKMSNGNLLVVYRAGVGHSGDKGSIKSKISTNNGATWGAETNVYTDATYDSRDPSLVVLDNGRIWLNFFLADAVSSDHIADGIRIKYSDDNGGSWSVVATINSGFTAVSACSGPIMEYPYGKLALPIYGKNTGDTYYSSSIIFSDDYGVNWVDETIIADGENDSRMYAEPNLIYLHFYGLTLCMMRSDTPDMANGKIYASFSADDGSVWSVPVIKFEGTGSPRMAQLKNHMLIIIYRNNDDFTEAIYRISRTNGYNWSDSSMLNDDSVTQMIYAGAVEYDEGILGVVVGVENVFLGDANIYFYRMYNTIEGGQLKSNLATGIAPLIVDSTTKVDNLNADLLDGYHASDLIPGASALDDLADVNVPAPNDRDYLSYDAGTATWINRQSCSNYEVLMADGEATATPLANDEDTDWIYGDGL